MYLCIKCTYKNKGTAVTRQIENTEQQVGASNTLGASATRPRNLEVTPNLSRDANYCFEQDIS